MNSHERDLFAQFERQPYVDLTEWREQLVEYSEALLGLAEEELHRYASGPLSHLNHETIMNKVLSSVARACVDRIEPVVQPGDRMRVKGNILYDIYTRSEHDFELEQLEAGSELRGTFQTVVVRDYVDENIFDIDIDRMTQAHIAAHIRHYGTHLVLADPLEVKADGSVYTIPDCESVLIPLMYRRLNLTGYLSWSM